ncbi:MAG: LapA family protein [Pseudomonadota bacterium]
MRAFAWTLRVVLFLALFLFALKNTDTVTLRLYFEQVWRAPLILVLLVFFAGGAVIGVLATLATLFRQRREIAALRRELHSRPVHDNPALPVADSEVNFHSGV